LSLNRHFLSPAPLQSKASSRRQLVHHGHHTRETFGPVLLSSRSSLCRSAVVQSVAKTPDQVRRQAMQRLIIGGDQRKSRKNHLGIAEK
jgi:hypothetical protein